MRTFIAVDIPSEAKMELDAMVSKFRGLGGRVSWVKAKNMHLTVKFIDDFTPEKLEALTEKLKEDFSGYGAQNVSLSGLGGFPNLKKPRVLWVGVDEGRQWFIDLCLKVDTTCSKIKIPKEKKKPSPHLTIGRVRDFNGCERMLESLAGTQFEYPSFEVNHLTIYKSDLRPQGAVYTVLNKISLNN